MNIEKLRRTIGGIYFPYCLMIAAGVMKTAKHVRRFAQSDVIPEWGSFTTLPSSGNGGRDYYADYTEVGGVRFLRFTQNSLGLPNPGIAHAETYGGELLKIYADHGKPLPINISGDGVDDTLTLIKRTIDAGFKVITVNGSCPNKAKDNRPVSILCYDHHSVSELFERVAKEIGTNDAVLLWKVSNGMPRTTLEHNRAAVANSPVFTGIITGNTVPNSLNYDSEGKTTILTEKHSLTRGGMGGPAILPFALDATEYCASRMPPGKVVIGCGGIEGADSVAKFLRAGATIVQMNSAFREAHEDPHFVRDILADLAENV